MTARHDKLLAHLLKEPTIERAAAAAGISESQALRYLKEPEFQAAYREARREVVAHAIALLQRSCNVAVGTLLKVATDAEAPASSRVSAARAILDASLRAVEIEDHGARIDALEAALKEQSNGKH